MKDLKKFIVTTIREYTIREYLNENKQLQKIVYHTSNEYFNYFNTNKICNIRGDLYGKGFYFSDNYEYVKQFGSILYECEIILNNPLDLTNQLNAKKALLYLLNKIDNINNYDKNYIEEAIEYNNITSAFRKIRKYLSFDELKKHFDGVIGYSEIGGKEYVVYNPNNIKILNRIKLN